MKNADDTTQAIERRHKWRDQQSETWKYPTGIRRPMENGWKDIWKQRNITKGNRKGKEMDVMEYGNAKATISGEWVSE